MCKNVHCHLIVCGSGEQLVVGDERFGNVPRGTRLIVQRQGYNLSRWHSVEL